MSRITPRPTPTTVRPADIKMMMAAHSAVDRAMKAFHETNPAGYHAQRPTMTRCHFDRACPFTASDTQ